MKIADPVLFYSLSMRDNENPTSTTDVKYALVFATFLCKLRAYPFCCCCCHSRFVFIFMLPEGRVYSRRFVRPTGYPSVRTNLLGLGADCT